MTTHTKIKQEVDDKDRRYFPRWGVDNRVMYKVPYDAVPYECRSRDINCAGMCISTNKHLKLNQKLKLTVYLSEDISIHVDGRVSWNKQVGDQNLFGVNFLEMSERVQNLILDYAFEINQNDLVKHWFKGWEGS